MKAGTKLKSAVCDTEVVVIRGAARSWSAAVCPWSSKRRRSAADQPAFAQRHKIGKRYVDAAGTLELLCVKAGQGSLSIAGVALQLKEAKPLPSSD